MFGNNKAIAKKIRVHDFTWFIVDSSWGRRGQVVLIICCRADLSEERRRRQIILEMERYCQPIHRQSRQVDRLMD